MPESLKFSYFVGWGFQALIVAIGAWGVSELSSLSKSVQELNVKMAVVVERDQIRGNEISDMKARISKLEDKKQNKED
jgi:hypothetical protein